MLVELPNRFEEYDCRQLTARKIAPEILLALEVLTLRAGTIGVLGKVGKRLMVKLEQGVGPAREGIVPAARIPGPGDVALAEPIADRGQRLIRNQALAVDDRR